MTDNKYEAREIDASRPSAARMYDYYLGGNAHYAVDAAFGQRMFEICPYLDVWAHHNREFLQRAARFMARQGIHQFLDIGSGIPTVGNTHQVVRELVADARVVYVDNDLEAVNQSYELLARENTTGVTIVEADLRYPESILDHADIQRLINFDQPLGLLTVSVWPFVADSERPDALMAHYRDRLASGSYVGMTHVSVEEASDEAKRQIAAVADSYVETSDPITMRSRQQFTAFFDGVDILEPGVGYAPDWRPDQPVDTDDPARPCNFAAVGYKP
ncbi:MAG: SAM-dependent methyltransferase [Sciscionella sp.]